ncbi:hypothetical protein ACFWOY_17515 [Streptomyces sp. NPDC058423]|uniref:hypothetical protein n=1 Tax=unclassified Streptomyces TaxID=2593676 RepID=UPI00364EDD55
MARQEEDGVQRAGGRPGRVEDVEDVEAESGVPPRYRPSGMSRTWSLVTEAIITVRVSPAARSRAA